MAWRHSRRDPSTGNAGEDSSNVHADHLNTPRRVTRPSDNAAPWTWESDPFGATPPNDNPEGLNPFEYNLRFLGRSSKSVRSVWSEMQRLLANTGRLCCSDTGKRVAPTGATRLRALLDVRPLPRWPPQRWDPANGSRAVQSRKEHYGRRVVVYRLSRTRPRNGVRCMLSRLQLLVAGTRRATSGASRTALVVLVSLIAACDTGVGVSTRATLEETARSLVPEDATDSQSVSDAPWVQIDFDVRREPLVFAINADRLARAQDDGLDAVSAANANLDRVHGREGHAQPLQTRKVVRSIQGRCADNAYRRV